MLKKTIKYIDYNGVERIDDFYFNLSNAELSEMELTTEGGFSTMVQKMINAKDMPSLTKMAKEMILKSFGEKSIDGKRFIKSKELSIAFSQTEAYSTLFMEFVRDDNAASDFITAIVPSELAKQLPKEVDSNLEANTSLVA